MKSIVCEMCGSNGLIKKDGLFLCQSCGTQYTLEEARKMMIEGTVEIQGTVKVDNTDAVSKYLANARRAKQKEDWEETEKYYNLVEQNDPSNIEAFFYSAYGKTMSSLVDSDFFKRAERIKILNNCISIIDDRYTIDRREENEITINNIADDLGKLFHSSFVYNTWNPSSIFDIGNDQQKTYDLYLPLLDSFKASIDNIEKVDDQPYLHTASIRLYNSALSVDGFTYSLKELMKNWIAEEYKELSAFLDKYWLEHKEEKDRLVSEKSSLEQRIQSINQQINNLPESILVTSLGNEITELTKQKNSLGLFNAKEKKEVQDQINSKNQALASAKQQLEASKKPFADEIQSLSVRIEEINKELTDVSKITNPQPKKSEPVISSSPVSNQPIVCPKCGWVATGFTNPKFCAVCGSPFA